MKEKHIGLFIIVSALIWAFTILLCSFALKGAPNKNTVMVILSTAAFIHLIFVWGPIGAMFAKMKKGKEKIAE